MKSKTTAKIISIALISIILIVGIYSLYPNEVKNMLEANTLEAGTTSVKFGIPRMTSTCCELGTESYPIISFVPEEDISNRGSVINKYDIVEATHICTGAKSDSCSTNIVSDSIRCPSGYTPFYVIKINNQRQCVDYGTYGLPVSTSIDNHAKFGLNYGEHCPPDITFGNGDVLKIEATCHKSVYFSWDYKKAFVQPTQITKDGYTINQWEKELFYYGHDIIRDDIEGSQQCLIQAFYKDRKSKQPKDFSKLPKEGDSRLMSWVAQYSYSLSRFLDSGKDDKNKIITEVQTSIPFGDCALSVYDYREIVIPELNLKHYNDEPVYCDFNKRKLIAFNDIVTEGGDIYKIPTKVVKENIECCENANCPKPLCCGTDFECTTECPCYGDQDCPDAVYSNRLADGRFLKTYSKCESNKCKKKTTYVKCSHAYCQSIGMICDENKGCYSRKSQCPSERCCAESDIYMDKTCGQLGYSFQYKCCTNLDARQGVGTCEKDCGRGCNEDGVCEEAFGETVGTCIDCWKCGDGKLNPKYENCKNCPEDVITVKGADACKKPPIICKPYDLLCLFNKYIMTPLKDIKNNLVSMYKSIAFFVAIVGAFAGFLISYDKLKKTFKKKEDELIKIGISALIGIILGYVIYVNFAIGLLIAILIGFYMIGVIAWKVIL